jgi:hypothetical protein
MARLIILCWLLFSLNATAQEQDSTAVAEPKRGTLTLKERLLWLGAYLDSAARRKVDHHYIEIPEKPWRVIVRSKLSDIDVIHNNDIEFPAINARTDWKLNFSPRMASSIGLWVGYRGTGIGFSKALTKNAGRYFSFGSTGAKYGINFQLRRFSIDEASLNWTEYKNGKVAFKEEEEVNTYNPVWIRSVYVNGYFVFNGRRYSQAAAYNQSVIQRRSAGSLLMGATWYQSSLDMSQQGNAGVMLYNNNIGRIKLHQASIGVGYGFNFVPLRGLVVNLMAMPTLSLYNRVKVYKYDCNYDLSLVEEGQVDDYGEWNPQTRTWANGKKHKPFDLGEDEEWLDNVETWPIEAETEYGKVRFNIDLRFGIAYNWKNLFVGIQGQLNRFSYKKDGNKVTLTDGYVRFSLGVRL